MITSIGRFLGFKRFTIHPFVKLTLFFKEVKPIVRIALES